MATETIQNQTTPSSPPTDYVSIYIDSGDKHIKTKDEDGVITDLVTKIKT